MHLEVECSVGSWYQRTRSGAQALQPAGGLISIEQWYGKVAAGSEEA
ncbi:MAG: hypothetical protein KIS72_10080 [Luteimonas sp.]|nr:hypothetical protein [Luteimonas sp.]